jgi:hypothetical protein
MMFMGVGLVLVVLLFVLLVGVVIVAVIVGIAGLDGDFFERLRAPGRSAPEGSDAPAAARHCNECGHPLQRGWAHCPGCGVEVHWV